jgi:hypothetical protein
MPRGLDGREVCVIAGNSSQWERNRPGSFSAAPRNNSQRWFDDDRRDMATTYDRVIGLGAWGPDILATKDRPA